MNPTDVLWRVLERLEENRRTVAECLDGLDPENDKELYDALLEVEQLTQTQINIVRRAKRRVDRLG